MSEVPSQGESRPIRVLINALHSKSGGGLTYLDNIVPVLGRRADLDLHIVLHAHQLARYEGLTEFARLHVVDFRDSMIGTLLWEQFVLPIVARMIRADVVYSPANYGPLFVRRGVILIRNSIAVATQETRLPNIAYWIAMAGITFLSLFFARRAVAVSRYAASTLTRWPFARLRRKITMIPHGVSPEFRPGGEPREWTLLAVGDIYIQKNYHGLLEAFYRLVERHPGLTLTIAGDPLDKKYADALIQSVAARGLTAAVRFAGHVGLADLRRLYQTCRVFVFASTVETFGNPLIEALACGTPTACSDRAAMPEIAGDAVEYFDPGDTRSMCRAIERLLTDEQRSTELSERGLRQAANFSWTRCGDRLAEVLNEAAK